MRIKIRDHQRKSFGIEKALHGTNAVIHPHTTDTDANILLIDHDGPEYYRDIIDEVGLPAVLYTHGAPAWLAWDGGWSVHPKTIAYLAQSPGEAKVMEIYGYPRPVHVIGWHWCVQRPFKPVDEVKNVLFAPIHPLNNGFLRPEAKEANRIAYKHIAELMGDQGRVPQFKNLTVRCIGTPEQNGLQTWKHGNFGGTFKQATPKTMLSDIDAADLVISAGTFAYLAVARGKPTIMIDQDYPPGDGHSEGTFRPYESWDEYRDYAKYPYSIDYIWDAMQTEATKWRNKFIGDQIDSANLVKVLEGIINA